MGDDTDEQVQTTELETSVKPPKKSKQLKIILIVVGSVLALIAVVTLFFGVATNAAVNVSNKFIDSIQASNSSASYALFSTEAMKTITESDFKSIVDQIGPILNTSEKIVGKEINGETGTAAGSKVTYEIVGTDGKTYRIIVNLTKQGSDWKVLNFDSKLK